MPGVFKSTACRYNIDPVKIRQWNKMMSSLNLESGDPKLMLISRSGQAMAAFHSEKTSIEVECYNSLCSKFDAI